MLRLPQRPCSVPERPQLSSKLRIWGRGGGSWRLYDHAHAQAQGLGPGHFNWGVLWGRSSAAPITPPGVPMFSVTFMGLGVCRMALLSRQTWRWMGDGGRCPVCPWATRMRSYTPAGTASRSRCNPGTRSEPVMWHLRMLPAVNPALQTCLHCAQMLCAEGLLPWWYL